MYWITVLSLSLVLTACSSTTQDDYREEAQGINYSLLKELQAIHSREDIIAHTPKLKKLFSKLTDVIIASHEIETPGEPQPLTGEERQLNDRLLAELTRIYSMNGGRDLIEKAQQESLYRLDAYLQKKNKPAR